MDLLKKLIKKLNGIVFLEKIINSLEPSGIIVYGNLSGNIFTEFEDKCKFYYY